MTRKIITLEDKYSTLQKTMIYLFSSPFILKFIETISSLYNVSILGFITSLLLLGIAVFLVVLPFAKKGFLIKSNQLFLASFLFGKCLGKKKIDITNSPVVSVLEFSASKALWASAANPNLKASNYIYQLNILNEKHTEREKIMFLENKENIDKALKFLTDNLDLRNEVYSPNYNR